MPAVKSRFSVARCCCTNFCEDCCNGNAPTEWDIEVDLSDGTCTTCDELVGGIYTLARLSNQICKWRFSQQGPEWQEECSTGYAAYGNYITSRYLSLQIRCVTETQYYILAELSLTSVYNTSTEKIRDQTTNQDVVVDSTNGSYYDYFKYDGVVDFDDFNCNEQSDFELQYQYARTIRNFRYQLQSGATAFVNILGDHTGSLPIGEQYAIFGRAYWRPICEPPAVLKLTSIP